MRNAQDATLRNIRSIKRKLRELRAELKKIRLELGKYRFQDREITRIWNQLAKLKLKVGK